MYGAIHVAAVREVFEEWGIVAENLPPNMTDLLQVMDLVVNQLVTGIEVTEAQEVLDNVRLLHEFLKVNCPERRIEGRVRTLEPTNTTIL